MTGGNRNSNLRRLFLATVVVCGLTAVPFAQQVGGGAQLTPEDALKKNVQTFELVLKNAIINAGAKVAQWARQIEPSVVLSFVADPEVRAVPLMDNSLVFLVDVTDIEVSSALWIAAQKGLMGPQRAQGATRVGGTPGTADPLNAPVGMTPSQYLTEAVREGLIDAMLDNSNVLPLDGKQTLTVACSPSDRMANALYRNPSKKLVLTVKAEDLLAFRQGKLSREAIKQRIDERRF